MLTTTLKFNSLSDLWNFKVRVHALNVLIQATNKLLTCELSEKDIWLACSGYAAKIVSRKA